MFLEEAAGISKYKERRRETEHRLADTRENLARVSDIRLELGAQIEKLDAQAKVATRYQELPGRPAAQAAAPVVPAPARRRGGARAPRAGDRPRHQRARGRERATLREPRVPPRECARAHYEAGDALNAAQGALYAANAEVAQPGVGAAPRRGDAQRLESQHTERRTQLAAWREQRAQLTQALAHVGGAGGHGERASRGHAEQTGGRKSQAAGGRAGVPRRAGAACTRRAASCSRRESRLAARAGEPRPPGARPCKRLAQRRERLESELQTLVEPDAAALRALEASGARARAGRARRAGGAGKPADRVRRARRARRGRGRERWARPSASMRLPRLSSRPCGRSRPPPTRTRRCANGSSATAWARRRASGRSCASTPAGKRRWSRCCASACTRSSSRDAAASRRRGRRPAAGEGQPVRPRRRRARPPAAAGLEPLAAKVHAIDARGLAARSPTGSPASTRSRCVPTGRRARRCPPARCWSNREGHQFTRHTVGFHAPDPADAGLLARQAEIETTWRRAARSSAARLSAAPHEHAAARAGRPPRAALALEQAREEIGRAPEGAPRRADRAPEARPGAGALAGAQQPGPRGARGDRRRTPERSAQALADAAATASAHRRRDRRRGQVAGSGERPGMARQRAALAEQRRAEQQAEREAQDALFGERECASKIAEIDHSVRVIDQQIERADAGSRRPHRRSLPVDPIPARARRRSTLRSSSASAARRRWPRRATRVEAASGALRELEEERLQVEARVAPLRERIGELRLKEQAAQINHRAARHAAARGGRRRGAPRRRGRARAAPLEPAGRDHPPDAGDQRAGRGEPRRARGAAARASERKSFLDAQSADLEEAVRTLEDAIRRIDRETRELLRETFESVNRAFRLAVPDAVRRRRGEAHHDRRGDPRRGRAGDGAAAGQAQHQHPPAVGRREGADRHRAGVLAVPAQPGAVLPARRGRRAARRQPTPCASATW